MIKNIILSLFLIFLYLESKSQSKAITYKDYLFYWTIDDNQYYEINKKRKRLYWNGKAIDSTGISIDEFSRLRKSKTIYNDKQIISCYEMQGKLNLFTININGQPSTRYIPWQPNQIMASRTSFFINKNNTDFNLLDVNNLKLNEPIKISSIVPEDTSQYFGIHDIFDLSDNQLIVTTKYCYDGCYNLKFFKIDLVAKKITRLFLNLKEPNNESFYLNFLDCDDKYVLLKIEMLKPSNNGTFIYDMGFREVTKVLNRKITKLGSNIKNGNQVSDNVKTILDDGQEVIIENKFSLQLERSLYRAQHGLDILKDDLQQCDRYKLEILRSIIYAKHNFKFIDPFYQAYFNLFDFYNSSEKRNNRLAKVDHLFTTIDKKNLEAINKVLTKK